jgi:replication fork clamp-binding protein CrfC
MCLKYTTNPRSIILAVTAANTDIANSDSLKMAREVDPEGKRTLGVLTKLDLMDRGTDALDALAGRIIPLQLGYVGVVNRCQSDVEKGISIKEARRLEANFFATHKSYRLMSSRLGTTYLTRRLNQTLVDHIKRCLPDIKMRISKMLLRVNSELESIGNSTRAMDRSEQGRVLLSILAQFSTSFADAIEGRSTTHENMLSELYGGARISYIFNEIFSKSVLNLDPFTGLSDADIRNAIRNATGPRPALFVPEVSFETLVRRQIAGLTQAGAQCVEMVYVVCSYSLSLTLESHESHEYI